MKIKLEFDLTPKEFRESLGMPDVSALQNKAIELMKSSMPKDMKAVDMPKIVEGWMSQGLSTSRQMQQMFTSFIGGQADKPAAASKKKATKRAATKE